MQFDGADYIPRFDQARLKRQIDRVREFMLANRGRWLTVPEIAAALHEPELSVSAQIRNLRKEEHDGWRTPGRRRGDPTRGLYEFTILDPLPKTENLPLPQERE